MLDLLGLKEIDMRIISISLITAALVAASSVSFACEIHTSQAPIKSEAIADATTAPITLPARTVTKSTKPSG